MRLLQSIVMLGCMALTSACSTYSIQELRQTPPKGTAFQAALAMEYLRFSEDEARNVDWAAAGYFSQKGLSATYGEDIAPEQIDDWSIPDADRKTLEEAHTALLAALTPEQKTEHPEILAHAQLSYDCWLKALDGDWNEPRVAECREGFSDSMKALASAEEQQLVAPTDAPPTGEAAAHAVQAAYLIFFGNNQSQLDDPGKQIVDAIVADLLKDQPDAHYTIMLNGHTDTTGEGRYNFTLSNHRAEQVKKLLIQKGIPEKSIRTYGFGETDPRIPTPDNTPEPGNRRVEIFLGGL